MLKLEETATPIYILNNDETIDEIKDNYCHFIQGTNMFSLKRDDFNTVVAPVQDADEILKETKFNYEYNMIYLTESIWDKMKISVEELATVMRYFKDIFTLQQTEAAVLLMGHPTKKELKVLYVLQTNMSKAGVTYINPTIKNVDEAFVDKQKEINTQYKKLLKEGYKLVGTIHSHSDFSAFHSGIDDADEKNFDGIHMTIGNVDDKFSFCARLMIEQIEWEKYDVNDLIQNKYTIEDAKALVDSVTPVECKAYIIPRKVSVPTFQSSSSSHAGFVFNTQEMVEIFNPHNHRRLYVVRSIYNMNANAQFKDFVIVEKEETPKATNLLKSYDDIHKPPFNTDELKYLEQIRDNTAQQSTEVDDLAILLDIPTLNAKYDKKNSAGFKHARGSKARKGKKNVR